MGKLYKQFSFSKNEYYKVKTFIAIIRFYALIIAVYELMVSVMS